MADTDTLPDGRPSLDRQMSSVVGCTPATLFRDGLQVVFSFLGESSGALVDRSIEEQEDEDEDQVSRLLYAHANGYAVRSVSPAVREWIRTVRVNRKWLAAARQAPSRHFHAVITLRPTTRGNVTSVDASALAHHFTRLTVRGLESLRGEPQAQQRCVDRLVCSFPHLTHLLLLGTASEWHETIARLACNFDAWPQRWRELTTLRIVRFRLDREQLRAIGRLPSLRVLYYARPDAQLAEAYMWIESDLEALFAPEHTLAKNLRVLSLRDATLTRSKLQPLVEHAPRLERLEPRSIASDALDLVPRFHHLRHLKLATRDLPMDDETAHCDFFVALDAGCPLLTHLILQMHPNEALPPRRLAHLGVLRALTHFVLRGCALPVGDADAPSYVDQLGELASVSHLQSLRLEDCTGIRYNHLVPLAAVSTLRRLVVVWRYETEGGEEQDHFVCRLTDEQQAEFTRMPREERVLPQLDVFDYAEVVW